MPSLTWKMIALLTLIFAVAVFLWFIFLGPLSRCDRLTHEYAIASTAGHDAYGGYHRIFDLMRREGCMKGTEWVKDD